MSGLHIQNGTGIRWEYDEESHTLHIDGKGAMGDMIKTIRIESGKTQSGYSEKTVREVPWENVSSETEILDVSPDVSTIAATAFMGFKNLREAYLPGVVSIGISAFYMCEKLEAVEMPNVCIIGSSAFERCSSLDQLLINKANSKNARTAKLKLTLPKVMAVGNFAFCNCKKLSSISLPLCSSVGDYAFMWCESLVEANLPNTAQVGKGAFMRCPALRKAKILSGATVGKGALVRSGANWFEYSTDRSSSETMDSEENPDALVFFDIETTGRDINSELTEIAAVKVRNDGAVSGYFHTYAKPTQRIPIETVGFNGIDDDMVANAPAQRAAVELFLKFVDNLPVAGQNIRRFDIPIMTSAYCDKLPLSEVIDTLEIAITKEIPGAADCKQTTIYGSALAYGGMEPTSVQGHAHRALYDADVNRIIFNYLQTLGPKETAKKKRHSTSTPGISKFYSKEYKEKHGAGIDLKDIEPTIDPAEIDPANPLFGKHVCQTTVDDEMPIWQIVINMGGIPETNAVKSMDILIIGADGNGFYRGKPTRKVTLAKELQEGGKEVLVITENEFYQLAGVED